MSRLLYYNGAGGKNTASCCQGEQITLKKKIDKPERLSSICFSSVSAMLGSTRWEIGWPPDETQVQNLHKCPYLDLKTRGQWTANMQSTAIQHNILK